MLRDEPALDVEVHLLLAFALVLGLAGHGPPAERPFWSGSSGPREASIRLPGTLEVGAIRQQPPWVSDDLT
jgi:hypothetical protein